LPRTLETARRVLDETGQSVDIEVWPEWEEIRGGHLKNLSTDDIERAFLSVFDGVVPEETQFLGGETIGELLDRALPAMARLRADASWDTVLLVLHGGVNRALLSHAITAGGRAFFGHLSQATGCINALDVGEKPGDFVIHAINHSPPSPLHTSVRNTTMELLYAQFIKFSRSIRSS
jgi:probable phosphoglycerate mutase